METYIIVTDKFDSDFGILNRYKIDTDFRFDKDDRINMFISVQVKVKKGEELVLDNKTIQDYSVETIDTPKHCKVKITGINYSIFKDGSIFRRIYVELLPESIKLIEDTAKSYSSFKEKDLVLE